MVDVSLLTNKISKRNIAALFIIGIISSVSYFLINYVIEQQQNDAVLVNISGQQRMLSQKIALSIYQFETSLEQGKPDQILINKIQTSAQKLSSNQARLSNTLIQQKGVLPQSLHLLYFQPPVELNERISRYTQHAVTLAKSNDLVEINKQISQHFNEGIVEGLLVDLNRAVIEIEQHATHRIVVAQRLETVIWVMIILTLLMTYFFLLKPTQQLINANYLDLQQAKNQSSEFKFAINKHAIVYKIDLKGKVTYINKNFTTFYGYDEDQAIGLDVRKICADSYQDKDYQAIVATCYKRDYWHGESINKIKSGRELWLDTTIVPLKNFGEEIIDFIVIQNDISEQKQTELALNELHKITSQLGTSLTEKIEKLLLLGKQLFNLPLGIVSEITDETYTVLHCISEDDGLKVGQQFEFKNTYCFHTYKENRPLAFHHVADSEIKTHPCYQNFGLESYIGVPIFVDGNRFGTLNFASIEKSNRAFSERELELIQLFANWIGAQITKVRQDNQVLSQQHMMEHMAEQALIGAWEVDLINNQLYWSPMTKIIHEVPDDFEPDISTAIQFYKKGESREAIERAMEQALLSGKPYYLESQIITQNGVEKWVAVRGSVEMADGKCVKVSGSFQDITDRINAQKQLQDNKERLDFVMESTAVGIWDWEINTGETVFNERWANIIGYNLAELAPINIDTWLKQCHPDDGKISEKKLNDHWQGKTEHYICETRMRHKAGHWVWVLDTGKTVEWHDDGSPKRMIGTHIDITEQKASEDELHQFSQRMTLAADSAGIGVWELNVQTDELKWDRWMYKLYGVNEADFTGSYQVWEKGLHPDDAERAANELQQAISGAEKFDTQFRIIWPSGEIRHIRAAAIIQNDEHGEAKLMIGVNYDVTDRVENELALTSAKQEAEAGAQAKSEFLASMSHEIRTPMNGVIGMLDLLKDTRLNNEQQQKVNIAQDSANSLLTLINDILDFSKIDAGKLELESIPFNLNNVVNSFAHSMALQAQQKGLELVVDTSEVSDSLVIGDPNRIRQILINLVANAIKFSEQGEVLVKVSLTPLASNSWDVMLVVKDTGIGIPLKQQKILFDAFKQLDASTTRQYGGTGLGLAIVKRLCQEMGGDINVVSIEGEGSTFSCQLILGKAFENNQPRSPVTSVERVLVVDGNELNAITICQQLKLWGIKAQYVNSADDALALCQQLNASKRPLFDLMLIDVADEQVKGRQLIEMLDAESVFDQVRLALLMPLDMPSELMSLMALNVHQHFSKPITSDTLIDILNDKPEALESLSSENEVDDSQSKVDESNSTGEKMCGKVLLVEDNRINQKVALGVLNKLGLETEVAQHGLAALEVLRDKSDEAYQLIFMDCQMPEMDGYQATKAIRAGEAGSSYRDVPIVAMTANAMVGDKEKCLAAGMDDYLTKPINKDKVLLTLQKYLTK